jgi:hypothetical protein
MGLCCRLQMGPTWIYTTDLMTDLVDTIRTAGQVCRYLSDSCWTQLRYMTMVSVLHMLVRLWTVGFALT